MYLKVPLVWTLATTYYKMEDKKIAKFTHIRDTLLSPELKAQFEAKLEHLHKELAEENQDWNLSVEKNGLKLFNKKDDRWIIQKSETDISLPQNVLIPYLQNTEFRKKYDNLLESYEYLKKVQDNVQIVRSQIKGKYLIISPRDFITYRIFGLIDENVAVAYSDLC